MDAKTFLKQVYPKRTESAPRTADSFCSWTSMAQTPLEPWKDVQDRGNLTYWVLIIVLEALGQEE